MKVNDKHLSLLLMANRALLDDLLEHLNLNGNFASRFTRLKNYDLEIVLEVKVSDW